MNFLAELRIAWPHAGTYFKAKSTYCDTPSQTKGSFCIIPYILFIPVIIDNKKECLDVSWLWDGPKLLNHRLL